MKTAKATTIQKLRLTAMLMAMLKTSKVPRFQALGQFRKPKSYP